MPTGLQTGNTRHKYQTVFNSGAGVLRHVVAIAPNGIRMFLTLTSYIIITLAGAAKRAMPTKRSNSLAPWLAWLAAGGDSLIRSLCDARRLGRALLKHWATWMRYWGLDTFFKSQLFFG